MLICVATVSAASAQYYRNNIFGVRGGLNITSLALDAMNEGINRPAKFGWSVGVSDQILLSQSLPFYFETGLYLSNKGGKWSQSIIASGVKTTIIDKIGMTYMQIPLKINYHFEVDGFSIEPFVGFHYALGLWGRSVDKTKVDDENNSANDHKTKTVTKLYKDRDFRRSDVGVSLGLGIAWSDIYASVGWERGFLNLSKISGTKARNTSNFIIGVGYNF